VLAYREGGVPLLFTELPRAKVFSETRSLVRRMILKKVSRCKVSEGGIGRVPSGAFGEGAIRGRAPINSTFLQLSLYFDPLVQYTLCPGGIFPPPPPGREVSAPPAPAVNIHPNALQGAS
jgi:hypothetical protein